MTTNNPMVTFVVISWNRFHYLKATLESAKYCLVYDNIEWIVIDNESKETGLKEFIDNLHWVDVKIFKKQTHADAMNQAVDIAKGDFIIIWPEDVQFIARGNWLEDTVKILSENRNIGTVGLDFLRRKTYVKKFSWRKWFNIRLVLHELITFKFRFRFQKRISYGNVELRTLGHLASGVVGSGIPSLARIEVWKTMGRWNTTEKRSKDNIIDSSLGAETYMTKQFYSNKIPWQHALLSTPVAADIVTDPIGTKGKVRDGKRFGKYFSPVTGANYYEYLDYMELIKKDSVRYPLPFEENVSPIGFDLPFDNNGNLLKASYINEDIVEDV
jgi:glycosyltransferase involved in cell wall biosynthesis